MQVSLSLSLFASVLICHPRHPPTGQNRHGHPPCTYARYNMDTWHTRSTPLDCTVLGKTFQHHSIITNTGSVYRIGTLELIRMKGIVWKYQE